MVVAVVDSSSIVELKRESVEQVSRPDYRITAPRQILTNVGRIGDAHYGSDCVTAKLIKTLR